MSKHKSDSTDPGRRLFMKTMGVAGGAVAAVAIAGEASAEGLLHHRDPPDLGGRARGEGDLQGRHQPLQGLGSD